MQLFLCSIFFFNKNMTRANGSGGGGKRFLMIKYLAVLPWEILVILGYCCVHTLVLPLLRGMLYSCCYCCCEMHIPRARAPIVCIAHTRFATG